MNTRTPSKSQFNEPHIHVNDSNTHGQRVKLNQIDYRIKQGDFVKETGRSNAMLMTRMKPEKHIQMQKDVLCF